MNDAWKPMWMNTEKSYSSRDILHEIEQTIAELETYLETNHDDEIALVQYQQFLNKREDLTHLLEEACDKLDHSELHA